MSSERPTNDQSQTTLQFLDFQLQVNDFNMFQ